MTGVDRPGADGPFLQLSLRCLAGDGRGVAWPPAPAWLVRAWAAVAELGAAAGIDWLLRQPAPLIVAGDTPPRPGGDEALGSLAVLWPLSGADEDGAAVETLIGLGPRTLALGAGPVPLLAVARATLVRTLPDPGPARRLWLPRRPALPGLDEDRLLPVAVAVDDVDQAVPVAYRPSDARPRAALVACVLCHPEGGGMSWGAGDAALLAGMVRHALIVCAGDDADLAAFAAGHASGDPDERVAIVPVPSTGGPAADGRLRCVLLTVRPPDADRLARLLAAALPDGLALINARTGAPVALAVPVADARAEPAVRHWLRPTRRWASVQPVILPGLDSGQARRTRKLILRALAHAGIDPDQVEALEFGPRGFLPESVDYRDLFLKDRDSWRRMPAVHVRLTFRAPILGPLVLGQGRNAGVGTLVPCADPE